MRTKGVTLVEVLIASVILALAIIPLFGLMGSSHKQIMLSTDELRLAQVAAEILEQVNSENLVNNGDSKDINLDTSDILGSNDNKIKNATNDPNIFHSPLPGFDGEKLKCKVFKEDDFIIKVEINYDNKRYVLGKYINK